MSVKVTWYLDDFGMRGAVKPLKWIDYELRWTKPIAWAYVLKYKDAEWKSYNVVRIDFDGSEYLGARKQICADIKILTEMKYAGK